MSLPSSCRRPQAHIRVARRVFLHSRLPFACSPHPALIAVTYPSLLMSTNVVRAPTLLALLTSECSLSPSLLNGDHAQVCDPGGEFNNRVEGTSTHDNSSSTASKSQLGLVLFSDSNTTRGSACDNSYAGRGGTCSSSGSGSGGNGKMSHIADVCHNHDRNCTAIVFTVYGIDPIPPSSSHMPHAAVT
jgi:hypothetical protein